MTKTQIKNAMAKFGIVPVKLIGRGENWEVELRSAKDSKAFRKNICKVGGFVTGCGTIILRPGYESKGDWNDKASAWHY